MKLFNSSSSHGWVEACANGQVGCMGGLHGWVAWVGVEMVSSIVMYNFGGGPRGDPMNLAF